MASTKVPRTGAPSNNGKGFLDRNTALKQNGKSHSKKKV